LGRLVELLGDEQGEVLDKALEWFEKEVKERYNL